MSRLTGENFDLEGTPAKSELTGIVHGEISSPEAKATEKEMLRRDEIMRTLDDLEEKHGNQDDIARAFENASGLSNASERLEQTIENLYELTQKMDELSSDRQRLNGIIMQLQEVKMLYPAQKLSSPKPETGKEDERKDFSDWDDEPTQA